MHDEPTKACRDCGDTKPLTAFWPEKRRADGRRPECATCSGRIRRDGPPKRIRYEEQDHGYSTPCWQWLRARNPKGYGTLWDAKEKRFWPAHRWFYTQHVGPIPPGLQIDHLCRNTSCVNPEHLEAVTQAENMRRGNLARLTHDDVAAIRASTATHAAVAERFGVNENWIWAIRSGRAWRPDETTP